MLCREVVAAEVELISKSQEGQLRLDLHFALQLLQQREVEAHLTARFGTHGALACLRACWQGTRSLGSEREGGRAGGEGAVSEMG